MTTIHKFRRADATHPGKHGLGDWRVTLNGNPPEHGEMLFMLGMLLIAEDRYSGRGEQGRYFLWYFIDRLLAAKKPEDVIAIAEDCQETVISRNGLKKVVA